MKLSQGWWHRISVQSVAEMVMAASIHRAREVISLVALSLSFSLSLSSPEPQIPEFAAAFALSLRRPQTETKKRKELHSFLSLSRPQKGRSVVKGKKEGREERKEGWKLFGRGNLFFQSGTLELLSHMRKKGTALSTTTNTHFCEMPSSCVLSH